MGNGYERRKGKWDVSRSCGFVDVILGLGGSSYLHDGSKWETTNSAFNWILVCGHGKYRGSALALLDVLGVG